MMPIHSPTIPALLNQQMQEAWNNELQDGIHYQHVHLHIKAHVCVNPQEGYIA